jgi:hypothetical protein
MLRRASLAALIAACLACAGAPRAPAPGQGRVYGTLRLVPHAGAPKPAAHGAYSSQRMRDADLVDYSTPGFAVVYLAEGTAPGGSASLSIRDTRVEPRFEPGHLALGAGGHLTIENASARAHILSYPAAKTVRRLAPGERLDVPVPGDGEQGLYLLDVPDAAATLFAAPGHFAVVSTSGGYELDDVAPGSWALRAWHPRFPPVSRHVDVVEGTSVRVDLEMGVDVDPEGPARAN